MVRSFFEGGTAMTIGDKDGSGPVNVSWQLLGILITAVLLPTAGLMSWAISKANSADNAAVQIAEVKAEVREGFKSLREQVAGLPTQAATLKQVDERGRELIINLNSVAQSLASTDRAAYEAGQAARRIEQQSNQRFDNIEKRLDRIEQTVNHPVPLRETR